MSPPHVVVCYPINSQLQCLVITTLHSIYGKKTSQIRHPLHWCFVYTTVDMYGTCNVPESTVHSMRRQNSEL